MVLSTTFWRPWVLVLMSVLPVHNYGLPVGRHGLPVGRPGLSVGRPGLPVGIAVVRPGHTVPGALVLLHGLPVGRPGSLFLP